MSRTRMFTRAGAAGLAIGAALALSAVPASAHTALESSDPAAKSTVEAPTEITLKYNQPVSLPRVVITDEAKGTFTAGPARAVDNKVTQPVADSLPNGKYTVGWRVVSADGHPVSGTFTFTVKGSSAPAAGTVKTGTVSPQPTLRLDQSTSASSEKDSGGSGGWLWLGLIALVVVALGGGAVLLRRRTSG